jgi:hypothetical protein
MKYLVSDEKFSPDNTCWDLTVEADNPKDAALIGAERAWDDWAHESNPPFWLYVNGVRYEIDVEFEPIFSASRSK